MANKKEQVEDIFAEVEKDPVRKKVGKKKKPAINIRAAKKVSPASMTPVSSNMKRGGPMKVLVTFVIVVVLGMAYVIISGYFGNNTETSSPNGNVDSTKNTTTVTNEEPSININAVTAPTPVEENTGPLDTDGDGLSDDEEKNIGTSSISSDTDGDGLFDREEVEVYKTNPTLKDTDGDGKADGVEVDNGYNPNGEGLLLDLEESIKNL